MKPRIRTLALAAALIAAGAAPAAGVDSAMLRPSVSVTGDVVRLGDLFAGAGERADVAVARAPAPGRRAVFDARWLYRVARAHGLAWRPTSLHDQSLVERASLVIDRETIEEHVLAALVPHGVDPRTAEVEISNRLLRLHVATDSLATVAIEDIAYDRRTRTFGAVVQAPADRPLAQRLRITGRVHRIAEVPVPVRRIGRDEVIAAEDVTWLSVRAGTLPRDTIVAAEDLIGQTPRRGLRAGMPVSAVEVQAPVLVPKGELVTIVLATPQMTLTAQGRALEDGSAGEAIRVSNAQSSMVVEAVVTGAGMVAVRLPGAMAMN